VARRSGKARVSGKRLKALAAAGADLAAAAEALAGVPRIGLAAAMERRPGWAAAWRRGRLLYELGEASALASIEETASTLEMDAGELRRLIASDGEVAEARRRARVRVLAAAKVGLVQQAEGGSVQAVRELLARVEAGAAGGAGEREQMTALATDRTAEAMGVSRQTIHAWATRPEHPAPRNGDGSYHLPRLIEWRVAEVAGRSDAGPGSRARSEEAIRQERLEKLRMENERERGELVRRDEHLGRVVAIGAAIVAACEGQAEAIAAQVEGLGASAAAEAIEAALGRVREAALSGGQVVRLPPLAGGLFQLTLDAMGGAEPAELLRRAVWRIVELARLPAGVVEACQQLVAAMDAAGEEAGEGGET